MPPPKGKDKGAVKGKQGTQLKDVLPPNAKQPREGEPIEPIEEQADEELQKQERDYEYCPYPDFPLWPGNQEVQALCDKEKTECLDAIQNQLPKDNEDSADEDNKELNEDKKFSDQHKFYLPPSFNEFERNKIEWIRPEDYLLEIAYEKEVQRMKLEKKGGKKERRGSKRFRLDSSSSIPEINSSTTGKVPTKKTTLKQVKQNIKVNYKVISYQERPETEEEMKKRKDEEEKIAGKDKKKPPPKKGGVEEEEPPQMVSVAIETNLDMGFLMPTYSKWLTSQLQFIKDRAVRDTKTKEPIWRRIFPQENGIPTKSLNGKYKVKLRFLGEERLVEVDDKMPCDNKRKLMFPRTTDSTEIWPQILIKAFFKLYSFKWYPGAQYDRETGDTSLVYALTGLIGERIKIDDFHKDGMETLRKHLSDDYYFNNKTYLMAYCGPTFKPKIPSQMPGNQSGPGGAGSPNQSFTTPSLMISNMAQTQKQKLAAKLREIANLALSITYGKKISASTLNKSRSSYVIPGFGYALMDIFENKEVDMDTIVMKPPPEEAKSPFISPSRAERLKASPKINKADSTMKKKKKRGVLNSKGKEKHFVETKKAPPIQYRLIKIKTSVGNYPILNVNPPFTNTEIKLAKKCKLNGWTEPPPEFSLNPKIVRQPGKDTKNFKLDLTPMKEEIEVPSKTEETKLEGDKPKVLDPKTRAAGGLWLQAADFPFCFQYFIIFHNDQKIKNRKVFKDLWTDSKKSYKSNEKEIYIRIRDATQEELKTEEDTKQPEAPIDEDPNSSMMQEVVSDKKKRILIGFSPNPTLTAADKLPRYYCRFKRLGNDDKLEEKVNSNNILLSDSFDTKEFDALFSHYFSGQMLELDQAAKYLFKPQVYAPQGFCLWLASESRIDVITHSQYSIEEQKCFSKKYQVEQTNLRKGTYCYLFKYDFNPSQADTEVQFIMSMQDKYLYEYMRLKIVDRSGVEVDPSDSEHPLSINEKLVETTSITTLNSLKTEKITFQPNNGKGYSLICETIPPYNIPALTIDLEMISSKDDLELERVEMMDPLIYSDAYVPYKYGIIFKEKLYVANETSSSFNIRITQKVKVQKPKQNSAESENQEVEFEEVEETIELLKNFKVDFFDSGELISSYQGNGHLTISHFNFRGNAGLEERPKVQPGSDPKDAPAIDPNKEYKHYYVMQATFDKNDWKEAVKKDSQENQNIRWEVKVFSSDTLAIVKDTDKEDKENELKNSWEVAEPGRAEKSKKSRIRYIALTKQAEGLELTEEEKEVLKEKRVRGTANLNQVAPDPKAAKGGKGDKKAPVVEEEEKIEEPPKEYPKSTDYTNLHFREFIHHFESDRMIHVKCNKSGARLRNETEIEERQKKREDEVKKWEEVFNTRIQFRDDELKDREQKSKQMIDILMKSRKDFKEITEGNFTKRNQYRELISNRKHKEILLMDILNSDKVEIQPLEQALQDARDALVKQEILDKAVKKVEILKYSKGIEDQLQIAVSEKNPDKMRELVAKIEKENLPINPKLVGDAKNALSKIK